MSLSLPSAVNATQDPALIREFARLLPISRPEDRFISDHERQGSTPSEMVLDVVQAWGNSGPTVLYGAWRRELLSPGDLRIALPPIWCGLMMEIEAALGTARWVELFRAAEYLPPTEPIVVYRGAIPQRQREMSWTTDLDGATQYAKHYASEEQWSDDPQPCHVYRCTVEPEAVLCLVSKTVIGLGWEPEVIVDPSLLHIEGHYNLFEE